jgi:hypothetical protein
LEEFGWLEKLFTIHQKLQVNNETGIEIETVDLIEEKKRSESADLQEIEGEKDVNDQNLGLNNMKMSLMNTQLISNNMKIIYSGLKNLLMRNFNRIFIDNTIREIFRTYHILVWNYDISNLMTSKPKSEEIIKLFEWGKKEDLYNDKLNDFKAKVEEIQGLVGILTEKSQELLKKELFREDCEEIKKKLSDLEDNINSSGLILESENNSISAIRSWLNWQVIPFILAFFLIFIVLILKLKSSELFVSLRNNKSIEFTRISELLSLAKSINLPNENPLLINLSRIFECADALKEKTKKIQLSKREVLAALRLAKSENSPSQKHNIQLFFF